MRYSSLSAAALAATLALSALPATAQPGHYGYVEASFSRQNTDWTDFGDDDSKTFLASAALGRYVHVNARYNDGNVNLPRGLREDGWWAYGGGLHHYLSPRTSVLIGAERHEMETLNDTPTQRGWEYHVGIRHDFSKHFRANLLVGENDVIFKDTTFTVEGLLQLPYNLAASARIRDYDDLDLTEYELGLRWQFD